ncbi:MAG: hypoxanthine phosphoribosyltransferase [Leptolyngbya sp. PLA2]|nr:hypoxanthine phosphoribosyltransferase [Leptolyngbya sp. PL-A2]MCQ3941524.1 hypoxanthine phosphoribosyltransferase [cyanobacterium CYA1]MCZ7634549.1 phosphoribosyltransferase family protein [Phycisphaerales bacterium]MDL1905742.1 hypoxanthine phosphoribosyltransferase [Synechococcales cyanobacterium CNB]
MFPEIERVLIGRETIARRVRELGASLASDLRRDVERGGASAGDGDRVVIIPIMSGAMVFGADLIRELPLKLRLELVAVSSYPGRSLESKGAAIRSELPRTLGGRHVVIVDDILDSGQTIAMVRRLVEEQTPASVRACVLLRKDVRRAVSEAEGARAEYVGFDIPDEFVVGYGLDYDGYYRNYPEIATLKREAL